jgi:RNA polymerase sigma-70 factor (ECF subfamily)
MSENFDRASKSESFDSFVEAARGGDERAFRALVEPLGRELHAYAYRMLGGFHDADDVLQESRLKAWRALGTYEPRASFRAWMYRIVTNTCLDMLKARSRRVLPQDVSPPVAPGPPTTAPRSDILWLEPYPDALLPASGGARVEDLRSPFHFGDTPSPEQVVRQREGIRLAFVRVVQVLPPRQRAALILHDVLDWSVAEVAVILETTEAAINSALQRARATVARPREESPALASRHAEVVDRFVHAWESGDFDALVELLATDAVMSMPPWEYWLDGKDAVVATMRSSGTWEGEPRPGRYRIVPAPMNGEPGGLAYVRGPDDRYHSVCLTVMSLDADGRVAELTTFVLPELFAAWGFPPVLEG